MNEVRELRELAGLTQAEIGRRAGVAQPHVSAFETGRRRPSQAMVARLRAAARPRPSDVVRGHREEILAVAARHQAGMVRIFGRRTVEATLLVWRFLEQDLPALRVYVVDEILGEPAGP